MIKTQFFSYESSYFLSSALTYVAFSPKKWNGGYTQTKGAESCMKNFKTRIKDLGPIYPPRGLNLGYRINLNNSGNKSRNNYFLIFIINSKIKTFDIIAYWTSLCLSFTYLVFRAHVQSSNHFLSLGIPKFVDRFHFLLPHLEQMKHMDNK